MAAITMSGLNFGEIRVWVRAQSGGAFHLGKQLEVRGERTGKVYSRTMRAVCNGRQLGGAWGYIERTELPDGAEICNRCMTIAIRGTRES